MRFVFVLLSFALCDVHAASDVTDETVPLLGARNRQNVMGFSVLGNGFSQNVQPNDFVGMQYVLNAVPNMNVMAPTNNACPSLFIGANREKLNNAAWETWIIEHAQLGISEYSAAIRQAVVVRLADAEGWNCLYKNLVIEPKWIYKSLHSETMSVRKNFFDRVEQEAGLQVAEAQLNQRVLMLENERNALRQELATLKATNRAPRVIEATELSGSVVKEQAVLRAKVGELQDQSTRLGAAIEKLERNKVGMDFMETFIYVTQSLVEATKTQSKRNSFISEEEWKQIVQKQKGVLEKKRRSDSE